MSEKTVRMNRNVVNKGKRKIADSLVRELMAAPFKYRFKFAMKLLRGRF